MSSANGHFYCGKCKAWVNRKIQLPDTPTVFRLDVTCPKCGDVIHSGSYDPNDKSSVRPQPFRQYCSNPSCGALIEAMLSPDQQCAIPCPGCGGTILVGNPSSAPSKDTGWFASALAEDVVTQEFKCPTCNHVWEMTFSYKPGTKHMIKCPNPRCANPSESDFVV